MKYKIKIMIMFLALPFGTAVIASSPAFAVMAANPTPTKVISATGTNPNVGLTTEQRIKALQDQNQAKIKALEAKRDADKKLTDSAKQTLEAARQKSCTARSTELANKLANRVAAAKRHKAVFDKILARVQEFHDTKKLTTPNYDTLLASAKTAGDNADSSIATLEGLDISIDCTQPGAVAAKVSAFKDALGQTRQSLKDYRTAITNLIEAAKASVTDKVGN